MATFFLDWRQNEHLDEDAIVALLSDSSESEPARICETVLDGLTDKPTAIDLPGRGAEQTPYRPGGKPGEEKGPANTAQAARDLLEQYKRRRKT